MITEVIIQPTFVSLLAYSIVDTPIFGQWIHGLDSGQLLDWTICGLIISWKYLVKRVRKLGLDDQYEFIWKKYGPQIESSENDPVSELICHKFCPRIVMLPSSLLSLLPHSTMNYVYTCCTSDSVFVRNCAARRF